jgi:hypothetical protein
MFTGKRWQIAKLEKAAKYRIMVNIRNDLPFMESYGKPGRLDRIAMRRRAGFRAPVKRSEKQNCQ